MTQLLGITFGIFCKDSHALAIVDANNVASHYSSVSGLEVNCKMCPSNARALRGIGFVIFERILPHCIHSLNAKGPNL